MEKQVKLVYDGQAVQKQEVDTMGESGGLADDRTLANLFALAPFDGTNVTRGILPLMHPAALIVPNGATNSVLVNPFRAFVGSRVAASADAKENLRGIRSGISVADGATALSTAIALGANSSGNPRWDLIYAVVTPDVQSATVTRKVKDTTSGVVTALNVDKTRVTTVAIASLAGTPSATPVFPAVPADPTGSYNIALGYVLVPDAFALGDTVPATDIAITAPVLPSSGDSASIQVPNRPLSATEQHQWASGFRPPRYMPTTMGSGGVELLVVVDLTSGTPSHVPTDVVDSRDWRGRLCRASLAVSEGTGGFFPWVPGAGTKSIPSAKSQPFSLVAATNHMAFALGQTVRADDASGSSSIVISAADADINALDAFGGISLYVDHADGGKLKVNFNAGTAVGYRFFFWVEFTGVFDNAV